MSFAVGLVGVNCIELTRRDIDSLRGGEGGNDIMVKENLTGSPESLRMKESFDKTRGNVICR